MLNALFDFFYTFFSMTWTTERADVVHLLQDKTIIINGYTTNFLTYISFICSLISLIFIIVLCCLFVYKIIKLIGGLIR